MSTAKYEKHQKSRKARFVVTERDGKEFQFDTEGEVAAYKAQKKAARAAAAAAQAHPAPPPPTPPPLV